MAIELKTIIIAFLIIAAIILIVTLTLVHHIGGFLRTVEGEAQNNPEDQLQRRALPNDDEHADSCSSEQIDSE
ncbi:MAG: hypothetical protein IJH38_08795 [Clostridia bacterium]|nr:hypothetical protein [Clostridia bacterium]